MTVEEKLCKLIAEYLKQFGLQSDTHAGDRLLQILHEVYEQGIGYGAYESGVPCYESEWAD